MTFFRDNLPNLSILRGLKSGGDLGDSRCFIFNQRKVAHVVGS